MKILIIDTASNCLDFAMRCVEWGHEVRWYDKPRKDNTPRRAGEGIIEKIRDFDDLRKKWIGWADLIFLPDNTYYLDLLEPFRQIGYPIFGCSLAAAEWELDRGLGQKIFEQCGIDTIDGKEFKDYDSAISYVKKQCRPFVSKPSGDAAKAMSYVSKDAADMVYMLSRWKENQKYVKDSKEHGFILQEKISGIEMAVGGWFGPAGWQPYFYENFEYKKLMNGDLGVNTGEMGTLSMYVADSKLATKVLLPVTEHLEKIGYVGFVDVSVMIDSKGKPWPLEFTMRPGWPTFHNCMATHLGDPAQWMLDAINGENTLQVFENQACVSVVMALPDFPYSRITNKEVCGIPIYDAEDSDHIRFSEVMISDAPCMLDGKVVEMPCYATAGDYVAVITGTGETISGARKSAYSAVKKIRIPNDPFYRTDIGVGRLVKQLPELHRMGYAKKFRF